MEYLINDAMKGILPCCKDYVEMMFLTKKESTIRSHMGVLRRFFMWISFNKEGISVFDIDFGYLNGITHDDIMDFLYSVELRGDGTSRFRQYVMSLSAFFSYYMKKGEISHNPVGNTSQTFREVITGRKDDNVRMKERVVSMRPMTFREAIYCETIKTRIRDHAITSIFINTHIKSSHILRLNVSSFIDGDTAYIRVGNKNIKLWGDTAGCIREYLKERSRIAEEKEEALFISHIGRNKGHRLSQRTIQKIIDRLYV